LCLPYWLKLFCNLMRPRLYSFIKGVAKIGQVFLIHNKMFKKSPSLYFGDAKVCIYFKKIQFNCLKIKLSQIF